MNRETHLLTASTTLRCLGIALGLTLGASLPAFAQVPSFSPSSLLTTTVNVERVQAITILPTGTTAGVFVVSGAHVIDPVTLVKVDDTYTVTKTKAAGQSGPVTIRLTAVSPTAQTNTLTYTTVFTPLPSFNPSAPDPATNSAPGAAFSRVFQFYPTGSTFTAVTLSGTNIVPSANITLTNSGPTNLTATVQPLTNQSGVATFRITGVAPGYTNTVEYSVRFRPYPPRFVPPVPNVTMAEDTTNVYNFVLQDVDTPLSSLVLTRSSSNPSLIDTNGMIFGGSGSNRTLTLIPRRDQNGSAVITMTVSDGDFIVSTNFNLTVTPVPDPSTISGVVNRAFGDNIGISNLFSTVVIDDVDHNMPNPEALELTVSFPNEQLLVFPGNTNRFVTNGFPAQVTTAIQNLGVIPQRYRGAPGTINNVSATIQVRGVLDNITVTTNANFTITVINTPPIFEMLVNPTNVVEGQSFQPFQIDYIIDPDVGDNQFSLLLEIANPAQTNLGTFVPAPFAQGNRTTLGAAIQSLAFQSFAGIITNPSVVVPIRFTMTDGYGGTAVRTNNINILQVQTPPSITGIPSDPIVKSDGSPPFNPLPTVFVTDVDQGGAQQVSAVLTLSNPALGSLSVTSFPLQAQADLTALLRQVVFTPTPGALPIGQTADTIITVTVTDALGLSSQNNNARIRITSVNNAPQILNVPLPASQPVILPPVDPIRPFLTLGLTNDDTNNVLFTITFDNANKGTLSNLGGFALVSNATYQMSGQVPAILSSLTNIVYALNPNFLFPVDDPGGTTFTLSARDFALLTSTRTLSIQVQAEPRNHLVTRAQNDGLPGSFLYALNTAGNNDHITFALPEYPATIRMPGATANNLIRNVTIKGPGANLLTISGDNNGDSIPNRRILRINANVTIEGVTLSHGTAAFGGALLVQSNGTLTLRNVAVVDSIATEYGGAIDVDGGGLILDGCFIGRNTLAADSGMSGAGVSIYTDKPVHIINTTFSGNRQLNVTGDGGGALVAQNRTQGTPQHTWVTHATFAENTDASGRASALLSVASGTAVRPAHSIFADFSGRNLDVSGTGEIISRGGNLCDDSTKTIITQLGQSEEVFLLSHPNDVTSVNPLLAPLNASGNPTAYYEPLAGSPAINKANASTNSIDQRGVLRQGVPDSGAIEFNALQRVVINEISFSDAYPSFIEIYVRRDSTPVNLAPYSLYVDGVKVHDFASSTIIGTNSIYPVAGVAASMMLNPGFGVVVAFTNSPIALTSPSNITPVVRASEAAAPARLNSRGQISLARNTSLEPVARHNYLGIFLDPATGTNVLNIGNNSISLAPQFFGFALVPHGFIVPGPFGGFDPDADFNASPISPGGDPSGTPFGQDNAEPLAVPDIFTVTEDDLATLNVLANDFDGDGNDRLVIVDVSTFSDGGVGDAVSTVSELGAIVTIVPGDSPLRGESILFDPRSTPLLQALPVGVETIDTFYYEIIDIGSDTVQGYSTSGTNTAVAAPNHRLETGDEIRITGAVPANYNGVVAVTVLDDNSFTIPVTFAGQTGTNGIWESLLPRTPTSRSEASVSVRVIGVNDSPVAVLDIITNVTELTTARIMVRPELAGQVLVFPGDPIPAPTPNTQDIISNDFDIDTDDTWETLRVVGVFGAINPITGYSGTPGQLPVTVHAPDHGLATDVEILIANYGGHPGYNGYHTVTVLNDDAFTIPRFFVDNHPDKGVWVILNEDTRYETVTDVGATVSLTLRANREEDHLIYDASASSFLRGLAEDERFTNRFFYAVEDSHGAIGIGPIDVIVTGLNDPPIVLPDPDSLGLLDPLLDENTTLEEVLTGGGLDLMYTLPPTSGGSSLTDLAILDLSGTIPGTVLLRDFFVTDEDTPLDIDTADLLANDTDIDRIDILEIISVDSLSREGASLVLNAGVITYDPSVSSNLQALAREELLIDTFYVVVSDGATAGQITSLVAVLVVGLNDTPTANPLDYSIDFTVDYTTDEDSVWSIGLETLIEREHAIELDVNQIVPDDRLRFIPDPDAANPGDALVVITDTNITHDATVSDFLNRMSITHSFTNVFEYTLIDNSFLFATDDNFYVPFNAVNVTLDVLANDRDFTDSQGILTIVSAGPALHGGTVAIAPDGLSLIYSSPSGFVGDDYFRYIIENDKGDRNAARVMVRTVVPPLNGVLNAADDAFTVAAGETVSLNVLANDNMLPASGAGLTLLGIVSSSQPGQPILSGNAFVYTATNGLTPLTFRYEVSAGGDSTATADVVVNIVERRGTLNIQDDMFSVLPGSFDNELAVLANDNLVTESTSNLRIQSLLDPAANGTLTIHPDQTRLVYTPNPGFIGTEVARYVATDQIGGTGTGTITILVGRIEVASDFFTLLAGSPDPVNLDVLANDRLFPRPGGSLEILSVSPATPTSIGTLAANGGTSLTFTATSVIDQLDFSYVVRDLATPARTATGRVTIATVANGIYANPDRFIVRGGGADYEFDVLANDISYPEAGKIYSILNIGVGPNAPDQGGFVTIMDNKLLYAPAPGFFGEESFTYTMSDSINTDIARVTVSVRRGDLFANDDAFTVFYEVPAGTNVATSFLLPVTLNDRIQPSFNQTVSISSLGIGTNTPNQGGEVSIAPGNLALIYRPVAVPSPDYIEQFTYEISDGGDRRASATVRVRVKNRESNLVALTQDDAFTVARNSVTNRLPVLANDFVLPGSASGWTITHVTPTAEGGVVSISGAHVLYTAPTNFVGVDTFTYSVNDGLGGTGQGTVSVKVGALPVLESRFTVLSGTLNNELDVLANDVLDPAYADEYTLAPGLFSGNEGGSATVSANNTILYTPNPAYAGPYPYQESFSYLVSDDTSGLVTGSVIVIVHETGSDRSSSTVTLLVEGRDDPAIIHPDPDSLSKLQPIVDATSTPLEDILASGLDIQYLLPPTSGDPDLVDLHVVDLSGTLPGVIDLIDFYVTDEKTTYLLTATNLISNDIEIDRGDFLDIVAVDSTSREQAALNTTTLGDAIITITYDPAVSTNLQSLARDERVIDTFNIVVRELRPDASFSLYTSVVAVLVIGLNDTPTAQNITDATDEDSVWERTYAQMITDTTIAEIDINAVVPDDRFVIVAVTNLANPGNGLINMTATGGIVHDATASELFNQLADWQSFTNVFDYTVTDNSFLFAVDDEYHVAPGATRELDVLANDRDWTDSQGDLTILSVGPTFQGATVTIRGDGKAVLYTADPDFTGFDAFRYIIQNDLGDQRQARVIVRADDTIVFTSDFVVLSDAVDAPLNVTANDELPAGYALTDAFGTDAGGSVSVDAGLVLYTPAPALAYPYSETFQYVVSDGVNPEVTGTVRVAVHEVGSDRATATITLIVQGINDPPEIDNPSVNAPITDKSISQLFIPVTITEVDQQLMEPVDVEVFLDDPDKGVLINLGPFVDQGGGVYRADGLTAAAATAALREFLFVPTENRIPVPGSEITYFTITVTDNKSPLVVNTNTFIEVTAVNDPPVITGTQAGQEVYYRSTIDLFANVTIAEVDDLTLQPLAVTVNILPAGNGILSNLGAFVLSGPGTYTATNITAATATDDLRAMVFSVGTNNVPPGGTLFTRFRITVNDGFADPVVDSNTTVTARNALDATLRPTNILFQGSFGLAVDILPELAVVGAPNASVSATNSGLAILYRRLPAGTNAWTELVQLSPATSTTTNNRFGRSVALTEERLAVGAIGTLDPTNRVTGSVYLFERDEGGPSAWGQVKHIIPTNLNNNAAFGIAVALEGDLLAVGAPDARINATGTTVGAVMLFERDAGGPGEWGEIMRWSPTNAGSVDSRFGFSVSLSGDSLVVGAQQFDANLLNTNREGAVFHFLRDEGGPGAWGLAQFINPPQTNISREFGWSLSVDQDTLIVGAPGITVSNVFRAGRVYHYEKLGGSNTFTLVGSFDRHTGIERRFGNSVSVFGNQLMVGAPENNTNNNIGAIYYFTRSSITATNWTQVERILRPPGVPAGLFGSAVSMNKDIAIVGAPSDLSNTNLPNARGYAFIYRFGENRPPIATQTLADQFTEIGDPFAYVLPPGLFTDPDPDDDLVITVSFSNGANGIEFTNGVFSGSAIDEGVFPVVVTATDPLGATATASFIIYVGVPPPLTVREQWDFDQFGPDRFDPGLESTLWGGDADPDNDGRTNDEEYAFGTDPNNPDADLSRLIIEPFNLTLNSFTYFRRWNDPGLTFHLEATTDMETWVDWGPWILSESTLKLDDEVEFVTLQVLILENQDVLGFRVRVTFF
ncbi:MAG TPA: tandem-95 repeat protein [Kiritimatiellia bacterium]|nr:tandem-95 repeat protein [Kiritimatiellia bacterium]